MTHDILIKLFEHNNWANRRTLEACSALSDEQLDASPESATKGTIRETLMHLVHAQRNYLATLTMPVDARTRSPLTYAELPDSLRTSGEGLLSLVRDDSSQHLKNRLQTRDGNWVEPWVILVQVINHATEHREQINSMLSALGITPPNMDGWTFGDATGALVPTAR